MKHPQHIRHDWLDFFTPPTERTPHTARLFRNGSNQAVRLPKELEMTDTDEVVIYRVGSRLVIEPSRPSWNSLTDAPAVEDDFLAERPVIGIDPEARGG